MVYIDKYEEKLYDEGNNQIFEIVDEYEKKFKYAADNSPLPSKPDHNKVEELIIEMNKGRLLK